MDGNKQTGDIENPKYMFRFIKDFSVQFVRLVQKFRKDKDKEINQNQIESLQIYMNKFIWNRFN